MLKVNESYAKVRIADLELSPRLVAMAQRETNKESPSYDDVSRALAQAKGDAAAILEAVLDSYRRYRIPAGAALIGKVDGKVPFVARRGMSVPIGEPPVVSAMRAFMTRAALGQPEVAEPFALLAGEAVNALKTTPPFMAAVGLPDRGQAQAIEAFARQAVGERAYELIDLNGVTAESETVGLLDPELLKRRLAEVKPRDGQLARLVLHIRGAERLWVRNRAFADALKRLLTARQGTKDFVPMVAVFELGAKEDVDPKKELIAVLDAPEARSSWVSSYAAGAHARFGLPDAGAMAEYAVAALEDIFAATPALAKLYLRRELAPEVRELLGRALQTPHSPLKDVRERLLQARLKTDFVANPSGAIFELRGLPRVDPKVVEDTIDELHQENADFGRLADLFFLAEVAEVGDRPLRRPRVKQAAAAAAAVSEAVAVLGKLPADSNERAIVERLQLLATILRRAVSEAESDAAAPYDQLIGNQTQREVALVVQELSARLRSGEEGGRRAVAATAVATAAAAAVSLAEGDVCPELLEAAEALESAVGKGAAAAPTVQPVRAPRRASVVAGPARSPGEGSALRDMVRNAENGFWSSHLVEEYRQAARALGQAPDEAGIASARRRWCEVAFAKRLMEIEVFAINGNWYEHLARDYRDACRELGRPSDEDRLARARLSYYEGVFESAPQQIEREASRGAWHASLSDGYREAARALGREPDDQRIERARGLYHRVRTAT